MSSPPDQLTPGEPHPTEKATALRAAPQRLEPDVISFVKSGIAEGDVRRVPLLWEVAAGPPILVAGENVRDLLPLPAQHVRGADVFMLEVKGDSMSGDGVLDGDYVVVASDSKPRDGEMVVALVAGEATVKRLWHDDTTVHLEPSNTDFEAIILEESDDLIIQGKVIGVVRWHIKQGTYRNTRGQAR